MVAPLETHASEFFTVLSQAPKAFTLRGMPGGYGNSSVQNPMTSTVLWCHASGFLTVPSQAPKAFTLCGVPGGSGNSSVQDPTTSTVLRCHTASLSQTHLTGVRPRELLYSGSGALRS
jgi:hypothetical protein